MTEPDGDSKPVKPVRIRLHPFEQRVFLRALELLLGKKIDRETERTARQLALTLMNPHTGPRRSYVLPEKKDIQEFLRK